MSIGNRRNIIYTCGLLDKIYNLKNIREFDNHNSYAYATTTIEGTELEVGLCDNTYQKHILTSSEILMIEILLSWDAVLDEGIEFSNLGRIITFEDIDWIRDKRMRNNGYIVNNHKAYIDTIKALDELLFIYDNAEELEEEAPKLDKLVNIEYVYDNEELVGIKYDFNLLGNIIKGLGQAVSLNMNIFAFSPQEFMKYQILRYMVSSIYMCRVRRSTFSRTHKSILNAITHNVDGLPQTYYDYITNSNYSTKYLKRYIARLDEVMNALKESRFIKNYRILGDIDKRSIITGCAKVEVEAYAFKKRKINV